jgi:hypothetical protein
MLPRREILGSIMIGSSRAGESMPIHWRITGYDGLEVIFERRVRLRHVPDVVSLLQRLAARHLSEDEIIAASLRKSLEGYAPLLEPQVNRGGPHAISVGENPYYVAKREER